MERILIGIVGSADDYAAVRGVIIIGELRPSGRSQAADVLR